MSDYDGTAFDAQSPTGLPKLDDQAAPPTALVEPREPESTRHIVSVSMLRAAAGMLNACAEHLEPLAVGYGAHQMRSIANELSALAELVPSGSVATVVQPPAVVERAPLEQIIATWRHEAGQFDQKASRPETERDYAKVITSYASTLITCANELEALLLAWPSSRERDEMAAMTKKDTK